MDEFNINSSIILNNNSSEFRGDEKEIPTPSDYETLRTQRLDNDDKQNDIILKSHYAYGLICIMAIQLIVMNRVFLDVGIGLLKYESYVLHLYITGTLLELFGLVLVITKYLFKHK